MADDRRRRYDLLKDHYEDHAKSANYLLAAHGAGFLACVTTGRSVLLSSGSLGRRANLPL